MTSPSFSLPLYVVCGIYGVLSNKVKDGIVYAALYSKKTEALKACHIHTGPAKHHRLDTVEDLHKLQKLGFKMATVDGFAIPITDLIERTTNEMP